MWFGLRFAELFELEVLVEEVAPDQWFEHREEGFHDAFGVRVEFNSELCPFFRTDEAKHAGHVEGLTGDGEVETIWSVVGRDR